MILFSLIFFVMIVAVGTVAVGGFSFYLKRRTRRLKEANQKRFDEPPQHRSLFEPSDDEIKQTQKADEAKRQTVRHAVRRQKLIERAGDEDFSVLRDAQSTENAEFYDELLAVMVNRAAADLEETIRLAVYVSDGEFRSNDSLARGILEIWKKNSSSISVVRILHLAALTGSATEFSQTLDEVFSVWKKDGLEISGNELFTLFESHYWLLPGDARTSGAGFLLKERLTELRSVLQKSD